jgi:putative transposase
VHHPAVLQASAARAGTLHELTKIGQVELEVPRNRDGSFAPVIVKMRQRRLGEVDEIVLYARA